MGMLEDAPHEPAARQRVAELQQLYPLPPGCSLDDVFMEGARVGALELHMVGLVASAPALRSATQAESPRSTTGAAASGGRGWPVDRAYFELLERLGILLAQSEPRPLPLRDQAGALRAQRSSARLFPRERPHAALRASRSNGVALHTSWGEACRFALRELIERDRVLRSFAGQYAPRACAFEDRALAEALADQYSIETYHFGPEQPHCVAGVFLFPRASEGPLVYGFSAADSGRAAEESATAEALQRLAFLWGEALPVGPPLPAATPDYHQEYYLYPPHHAQLRAWLAGANAAHGANGQRELKPYAGEDTSFADLTPPSLAGRIAIARASSLHARVLRFGQRRTALGRPPHPIA
jgi:hypothetical protein